VKGKGSIDEEIISSCSCIWPPTLSGVRVEIYWSLQKIIMATMLQATLQR
jgi:hypothetical protein